MKVTQQTIFGELLDAYPETAEVLKQYLGEAYCLTCPGRMFDTIGNGAVVHGLSEQQMESLIEDLQAAVDRAEAGSPEKNGSPDDPGASAGEHTQEQSASAEEDN